MRRLAQTITLGTQSWPVRPLTVAQVQAIEPVLGVAETQGTVASAVAVLRIALARDHAEAAAGLDEIEAGAPEIAAALATVLRLGGFVPDAETRPGEPGVGAAPGSASTGAPSTPA